MYLILQQIAQYFWEMCLFKRGPAGLPPTPAFLALVISVYLPVSALSWLLILPPVGPGAVLLVLTIDLGVISSAMALLTFIKRIPPRRGLQTLIAMLGTGTIMLLLLIPFLALANLEITPLMVPALLSSTVYLWWLMIAGFILHIGCKVSPLLGSMFFMASMLTSLTLVAHLYPEPSDDFFNDSGYSSIIQ